MKVKLVNNNDGSLYGWVIKCPACSTLPDNTGLHVIDKRWNFSGDFEKPTFTGGNQSNGQNSYKCWWDGNDERAAYCCHSDIINGVMHFAGDCTHNFKNQQLELLDMEGED